MNPQAKYINEFSTHFEQVKKLWRENSQTLGFLPKGAFNNYAADKCILVAQDNKTILGYLLFRKVKGHCPYPQATIVHLCIDTKLRNQGIAKFLIEKLCSDLESSYLNLKITCRKDYQLDEFWIKLGFVFQNEIIGRSGQPLFKWTRSFREIPLPLIELINRLQEPKKFRVVIDANVCFRLQDPLPEIGHDHDLSLEAKALEADWIKEDISLLITDELPNEIQKNSDKNKRNSRISFIKKFNRITNDFKEVESKVLKLRDLFPKVINDNTRSDLYQLAHTAAGNCSYFVTQDLPLLNKAELLTNNFGITIITPGELISHVDELNRTKEYHPKRLAGSNRLQTSRLSFNQVDDLYEPFKKNSISERKPSLLNQIRKFLSTPLKYEPILYSQSNSNQLAFVIYDKSTPDILKIPIIRVAKSSYATTILRYVIRSSVVKAIKENRQFIIVSDMEGQEDFFERAFIDNYFTKSNGVWIKINIFNVLDVENTIKSLNNVPKTIEPLFHVSNILKEELVGAKRNNDVISFVEIEKKLHPLKIIGSGIPTYVIPIKPGWAQNLFDENLADQTLWGADENLTMSLENVFYRSQSTFGKIVFPARILWYVTKDKRTKGSKMIRACSYIDEVKIGKASFLFKKYQRFGVYRWRDISKMTKGDPTQNIMAIIFNNSELLPNPISLEKYTNVLKIIEGKKKPTVQSPQQITESTFFSLYSSSTTECHE